MLEKPGTFSALTSQRGPRECIWHPKLRSELINFDDETGLWWTENWQLWTVYLNTDQYQSKKVRVRNVLLTSAVALLGCFYNSLRRYWAPWADYRRQFGDGGKPSIKYYTIIVYIWYSVVIQKYF